MVQADLYFRAWGLEKLGVGCSGEGVFEGTHHTFTIFHESETPLSYVILRKKRCDTPSSIRHSLISEIFTKKEHVLELMRHKKMSLPWAIF